MKQKDLGKVLELHKKWLLNEAGGKRADLSGADLRGATLNRADLSGANLHRSNLSGANLSNAHLSRANLGFSCLVESDLSGADLSGANLSWTDLHEAKLSGTNLCGANLSRAHLSGTDLSRANIIGADIQGSCLNKANLSGANLSRLKLSGADLSGADIHLSYLVGANLENIQVNESTSGYWPVCPKEGSFVGWKKCRNDVIVKLLIPDDAQRSSATSRKCRCSKAVVLDVFGADEGFSTMDEGFVYKKGATVLPDHFDDDRWNECSGGIHFFMSRKEAECYNTL